MCSTHNKCLAFYASDAGGFDGLVAGHNICRMLNIDPYTKNTCTIKFGQINGFAASFGNSILLCHLQKLEA